MTELDPTTWLPRASLEASLEHRIASGGKCLVPYLTGGLDDWTTTISAVASAGADGIEVGIPFSDPVMDGPVIQEASDRALAAGATPPGILDALARLDVDVPLAVMTYVNLVYRFGYERFAQTLVESSVSAAILPDLPLEEAGEWCELADAAGVETVMLAAPTASDERLERVVARARGFVYAVGLLGITGEREQLAASARVIAARTKALTVAAGPGRCGHLDAAAGRRGLRGRGRRRGRVRHRPARARNRIPGRGRGARRVVPRRARPRLIAPRRPRPPRENPVISRVSVRIWRRIVVVTSMEFGVGRRQRTRGVVPRGRNDQEVST